jgi:hypothetical protein
LIIQRRFDHKLRRVRNQMDEVSGLPRNTQLVEAGLSITAK